MTAAHTLMHIDSEDNFGKEYFGNIYGTVVIGLIPKGGGTAAKAVFRYFAKIIVKDENIDKNKICQVDACVLQITTKMQHDVDGERCGEPSEYPIMHGQMEKENLNKLEIDKKEVDPNTSVKIIGFNQGGHGLNLSGINRYIDFANGYVCLPKFKVKANNPSRYHFHPTSETAVICATIAGHSGGPCIDLEGNVIGMLSRTDRKDRFRCYLVPSYKLRYLLKKAKQRSTLY